MKKQIIHAAAAAQEWFALQRPHDAADLPLTYSDRENLKRSSGINYIVSLFGRSLDAREFRTEGHPNFADYAKGVMASSLSPPFIREDVQLLRRYPPVPLNGMGPGLMWRGA